MNPLVKFNGDREFAKVLDNHPRQVGYAFRNTANESVAKVQKYARAHYGDEFVTRNTFTERGIQYDRAKSSNIEKVEAIVGGAKNREWLKHQEKGFSSDYPQASKHMRVGRNYKKSIRQKNYLNRAKFRNTSMIPNRASSQKGKAYAMLAISFRNGYGLPGSAEFFYFQKGEIWGSMEEGYYQFKDRKRIAGLDSPKIVLAYRLDNRRRVTPEPWLEDAIEHEARPTQIVDRFDKHLDEQLKRFS